MTYLIYEGCKLNALASSPGMLATVAFFFFGNGNETLFCLPAWWYECKFTYVLDVHNIFSSFIYLFKSNNHLIMKDSGCMTNSGFMCTLLLPVLFSLFTVKIK